MRVRRPLTGGRIATRGEPMMNGAKRPGPRGPKEVHHMREPCGGRIAAAGGARASSDPGGRIAAGVEPTTIGAKSPEPSGSKEKACDDEAVVVEDPNHEPWFAQDSNPAYFVTDCIH